MGLLSRRPHPTAPTQDVRPTAPEPSLPTILLTHEGWLVGQLVDTNGRVSDTLARSESIAMVTDGGYREVDRAEVLVIVPPNSTPRAELRIAKRRVPVTVDVAGEISISGHCHVLPGATVWDTWQRSASGFAPLTEAVIGFPDGTSETAEVVLVSRHAAGAGLRAF